MFPETVLTLVKPLLNTNELIEQNELPPNQIQNIRSKQKKLTTFICGLQLR